MKLIQIHFRSHRVHMYNIRIPFIFNNDIRKKNFISKKCLLCCKLNDFLNVIQLMYYDNCPITATNVKHYLLLCQKQFNVYFNKFLLDFNIENLVSRIVQKILLFAVSFALFTTITVHKTITCNSIVSQRRAKYKLIDNLSVMCQISHTYFKLMFNQNY